MLQKLLKVVIKIKEVKNDQFLENFISYEKHKNIFGCVNYFHIIYIVTIGRMLNLVGAVLLHFYILIGKKISKTIKLYIIFTV